MSTLIPKPPPIWPGIPRASVPVGPIEYLVRPAPVSPILGLHADIVIVDDVEDTSKRMRKLTRANLNAWKERRLKVDQQGLCALCGKPVDLREAREGAVDHNHDTGEVRGVLHRSCNAAEGKVANAAGAWGAKSMRYPDIIAFVKKLVDYWERPGCGVIYPTHKSAEESANIKRNKRNLVAKERRAAQKAQRVLRDRKESP